MSSFVIAKKLWGLANSDKERISFLWRDLLRVFLNLPVHYLYGDKAVGSFSTAKAKSAANPGQDDMDVEGDTKNESAAAARLALPPAMKGPLVSSDSVPVEEAEAWTVGTRILTVYGTGVVRAFRQADSMYSIGLSFGTAFVTASSIIGAEELSESALSAVGIEKDKVFGDPLPSLSTFNGESTITVATASASATAPASKRGASRGATATNKKSAHTVCNEPDKLLYSTSLGYLFMRMYHSIYVRLASAKEMSDALIEQRIGEISSGLGSGTGTSVGGPGEPHTKHPLSYMDAKDDEATLVAGAGKPVAPYDKFFSQLLGLMDQSIDSNRYEDHCRQILGNHSYVLFTMDKLLQQCIKTLQTMANEESFNKLVGLFVYHRSRSNAFRVSTALSANSGNCNFIKSMEGVAPAPAVSSVPAPSKKGKTPSPSLSNPSNAGPSAAENIARVQRALTASGVDPLGYVLHVGRLMHNVGSNEDIYRLQNCSVGNETSVGEGSNVIVCELLGPLHREDTQLRAARGYDPAGDVSTAESGDAATSGDALVKTENNTMDVA